MKLVITGDLRDVIDSYNREEISYSRMAEILNNKANERLKAITVTPCCKSDSEQLCTNCQCKPTQKLGFCNECFDNIYSRA
jgi:hypothetical protein|tara:strand:- start:389 stop:631 length:243 start_codon:yes stop_codon:yes gene_type:complete